MYAFQYINEILRVTNYVITTDFEYRKVGDGEAVPADRVLYKIDEYYGKNYRFPYNFINEFFWLNKRGVPIEMLKNNGWELHGFGPRESNMYFKGIDPNGRIVIKHMGYHIGGIIKAIVFLEELSQFNSWEQYKLLKEKEELQAKLELLTQEKTKLQAMLDTPD